MARLWSAQTKFSTWRRLWVALAEAQRALGLKITEEQIAALRAQVETIDFDGGQCLRAPVPARRDGAHPRPGRCRSGRPSDHPPGGDELFCHR